MSMDDALSDDTIDSVTVRHLRELRRNQDLFLDLLKRQTEMTGRLARDLGEMKIEVDRNIRELKSDVILLENRSITSAENDEFFRRKLESLIESTARVERKLDVMMDAFGKPIFEKDKDQ
ncbi:MAG: hypothetical protein ACKVON_08510 [Beijerinckiaceae bacterium]